MREKRGIFYITRILSKLSIIIPIMLAFSLYYDSKILYIEELDYMRSPYKTFGMFIAFNLIWQASGARTYFKGIYETFYHLLPTEAFLLLYFAQRHFKIAVLIAVLSILVFLIAVINNFKGKARCRTQKAYRSIKRKNYRLALIIVALLCCIPSYCAYFIYDMENITYTPSWDEISVTFFDDEGFSDTQKEELLAKNNALLQEFEEKNWCQKNTQERLNLSQQFLAFEADRLGIDPVPIRSEKLNNTSTIAYYDGESAEIVFDTQYLHKQTGQESMETLCEEIYHAMEDYIVTNMNWNLSVIDTQYFQELCDWKENFENYTSYDYDKYVSQPLEASAKKYAKEEVKTILEYLESSN